MNSDLTEASAIVGRYLTANLPGIGGIIKAEPGDFFVEEIPAYTASGNGEHLYLLVEKRNTSTPHMIRMIGSAFSVPEGRIGYAGLKDRDAITRQFVSVHIPESLNRRIELARRGIEKLGKFERIRIIDSSWHENKIKLGHLKGNHFKITIRNIELDEEESQRRIEAIASVLLDKGVPNYYGSQRFGSSLSGHVIAKLFGMGRYAEAFYVMFAADKNPDAPSVKKRMNLIRQEKWRNLFKSVPSSTIRVIASSYQSYLFNRFVERHLDSIGKVFDGQWAVLHRNGALFVVEDEKTERLRADRFEISATGPVFGTKMYWSEGIAGNWERQHYLNQELPLIAISYPVPRIKLKGDRRALRFVPKNFSFHVFPDTESGSTSVVFEFDLPSGTYATVLLREFMKNKNVDEHKGT